MGGTFPLASRYVQTDVSSPPSCQNTAALSTVQQRGAGRRERENMTVLIWEQLKAPLRQGSHQSRFAQSSDKAAAGFPLPLDI